MAKKNQRTKSQEPKKQIKIKFKKRKGRFIKEKQKSNIGQK